MNDPLPTTTGKASPTFSLVSIIAVIAAIFSFRVGAGAGLLLAIVAIVCGVLGMLVALLPSTRGGFMSLFSVVAGLLGIVAAIFKLLHNVLR